MKSKNKTTFFTNEITGEYYRKNKFFEESIDWGMVGWIAVMIAVCGIIYVVNSVLSSIS